MIFYLTVAAKLVSRLIDQRFVLQRAVFVDMFGGEIQNSQCPSTSWIGGGGSGETAVLIII